MNFWNKIRKFRDRKHNDDCYLVYTMGKVGSSSVEASLKERLPFAVVFHTHFLSDKWLNEILPKENEFFHGNIRIGKKIRDYLDKNKSAKVRIITLVRDPLIREMSGIFENWKAHYADIEKVNLSDLKKRIDNSEFKFCFEWFDSEFKEFTDFDIYSKPFDQERGFTIYQTDKYEILCMQLEKLDKIFTKAMKEFMNIDIQLHNVNKAVDKKGSELYMELKRSYALSEEKSKFIYDSKFMKHFYSIDDLNSFKKCWVVNTSKNTIDE